MRARSPMSEDYYAPVNAAWSGPRDIPPITRQEALRAARRLARHFGGYLPTRPRRCWIAISAPFNTLDRGWLRLVHDMSHLVHRVVWPGTPDHSSVHADLERRMVEYVVAQGWLDGTLRDKVSPTPTRADKLAHVQALIARWESKERRAKFALYKLRKRERYYQKLEAH